MKTNNLIPLIIIVGVLVLFFFPSPEENFLAYLGTALFFVAVIVFLLIRKKADKR